MKKILLIFLLIPILTFSQVRHSSKQLFKDTCTFNKSVLIPNGNLGIGTASPSELLYVDGTVGTTSSIFKVQKNSLFDNVGFRYTGNNAAQDSLVDFLVGGLYGFSYGHELGSDYTYFEARSNVVNQWRSNYDIALQSNTGDGNVGIGTVIPSQKLDVAGSVKIDSSLILTGIYFTDTDSSFTIPSGLSIVLSWKAGGGVWGSGNIVLPSNAVNGQTLSISGNWSSISLSAPFGQTIAYTPGIAQFRQGTSFVYRSLDSTWYPK